MEKIKDTIFKFLRLDNLVENLSGYFETRVELIKLEVREEVARVISHGLMIVALFLLGFLFLVFASVGLAHYLNHYYNSASVGFWIVSGGYGVPALLIYFFRKRISLFFEHYLMVYTKRKEKHY